MDVLIIVILIRAILGAVSSAIASAKGRSAVGWFFAGFLLDIIGVIIIACLSNIKEERSHREHQARENRRLREQLRQEQMKSEAFRTHTQSRLDTHDHQLGVDTRATYAALPGGQYEEPALLAEGGEALAELSAAGDNHRGQAGGAPSPPPPPLDPAGRQWHYESHGQAVGPIPEPQLLAMLKAGQLTGNTLLWTEALGDWRAANQIRALQPYVQA